MPSVSSQQPVITGEAVLRGLRWALHISVAILLIVGLFRTLASPLDPVMLWVVMAAALLFALAYGLGLVVGRRWPKLWLAGVTALWIVLLVLQPDFTWLAFPLFFLHMHLLATRHAVLSVVVLTVAVVGAQWWALGRADLPTLLGPLLGAVFAVVMALAYQALYAENQLQQSALEQLRLTREELAVSQREAGALAEREQMAREIHDTLAQGFSSVVLLARSAESSLSSSSYDAAGEQVATIRSTAAENLEEARQFVRTLHSGHHQQQPLTESLRRACQRVEAEAAARGETLRCRLVINGDPTPLPAAHAVALLRAAQASLSNVTWHAKASNAVVTVTYMEDAVLVDIVDDGAGFDVDAVGGPRPDGTGFGLLSLRERVQALGGELRVESAPGAGTAIAVRLPAGDLDAGDLDAGNRDAAEEGP